MFDRVAAKDYRPLWAWDKFQGSEAALKWAFRDLRNLEECLRFVPGRRVVVQAGGELGLFPKRLAEDFAAVYMFEPDPDLFLICCRTAPEPNIHRYQAALGNERKGVKLSDERRDPSGRLSHEGLTHVAGPGRIRTIRVDDLGLEECDLIYLDIEGYEMFALAGAEQTINECRPVIAVELNRNCQHYGFSEEQVRQWILNHEYERKFTMNSDEIWVPL